MKLFKKVLAVALVGAMAVSMLTACSSSSVTSSAEAKAVMNALADAGVSKSTAMVKESNKATESLQTVTAKIAEDATYLTKTSSEDPSKTNLQVVQSKINEMTEFSFAHGTADTIKNGGIGNGGDYDLYIWTNGADGKPDGGKYPYLYRVDPIHTQSPRLQALLSKQFVQIGKFEVTDRNLAILKKELAGVSKAGVSCEKIYGTDVLLVVVRHGTTVAQDTADTIGID